MLRRAWALSLHINSRAATQNFNKIFSRLEKIPVAESSRDVGGFPLPPRKTCPSPGNVRTPQHCSRTTCIVGLCMASGGDAQNSRPGHSGRYINRLSKERSPYLLQHAHNPVDWFPWGQEAFDKAKKEDKPIFLSVGYSTCHWCHVMERESFEDVETGKILSDNFVCIKVDREERPDVDKLYMTFVQWQSNREALESSGKRVIEALKKATAIGALPGQAPPHAPGVAQRCFHQLAQSYEEEYGGFREAPKFPTPVNLMFLMSFWATNRSTSEGAEALQMALHTMRMMALGGIHDHVAQGFHRYSTDSSWHVPHFEKMLYDQAQLAVANITAYQVSGEQLFADVARDVLRYVSRDLSDKSGGFYSAEDADSFPTAGAAEKREGAFCVWTAGEIRELLPEPVEGATGGASRADIFMHHYGVKEQGNVDPTQDPHSELSGQNVLIVRYSLELTAARFGLSMEETDEVLAEGRRRLAEVRKTRPPPHLDTKMLSSWNGLMLSGFARVGAALGDKALVERAVRTAHFLRDHLWDEAKGRILHACYRGDKMEVEQIESPIAGFLDDYAFVICGLLDLYEATLNTFWLGWAEELQQGQDQLFWDSQGSGYFCSDPRDPTLLLALKQEQDGAEPSGNSISAMNLLRLSHYTGRQEWASRLEHLLTAFSDLVVKMPIALPDMVRGLMAQHYTLKQVVICGQPDSEDTASLVSCVNALFLPHKVLMLADGDTDGFLYQRLPVLATLRALEGRATAYVCQNFTCILPVTCPQELRRQLLE